MSFSVVIAQATTAESDEIGGFILAIQRGEYNVPVTLADQPDLADIDGYYWRRKGGFWAARMGEKLVGTIGLIDFGGGGGALRKMFVDKGHRGAGSGIGAGLLSVLLAHARNAGFTDIYLGTTEHFIAAHRFYEKNGFSRVDVGALPAAYPRMPVDTIFFRLKL